MTKRNAYATNGAIVSSTEKPAEGRTGAAWAGDPPHRGAARDRLLEAAVGCIARDGLAATGIAAVAAEAGVSRPTVYRYFTDRSELVQAALRRSARTMTDQLDERLRSLSDPAEQAVEAVIAVLTLVPSDPALGEVWASAALDASAVHGFTRPTAVAMTRKALEPLVASAGWSEENAEEAVEVILRFILSLLASPEPVRTENELRAFLHRRMVPALAL